ncbi:aldehyde dehydrogenase family protein, partial [Escherichia coli]|nr:aldehyde dehydrogenase family protein [Escherichia coli]
LLFGSGRIASSNPYPRFKGDPDAGIFGTPTVWEAAPGMRQFDQEIFGPTINLVKAKDLEQALEYANAHSYGLSSAIYTNQR